jgi:hypothetical protein
MEGKRVRFLEGNRPSVDPVPALMANRDDSPQSLSTSDSSFGVGESIDLSSYQLAFALRGDLQALNTYSVGSHHLPGAIGPTEAENRGRPSKGGSTESIETRHFTSNGMDTEVPASIEDRSHNHCQAHNDCKPLCIRERLPYDTEMINSFQIDLGGGQLLPTVPEEDTHSNGSCSGLG